MSAAPSAVAGRDFLADEAGAIRAWHGSPHDFDKFSMDKIGTGEGAQAYGHGLYFAEKPDVARGYRDALTNQNNIRQQVFAKTNASQLYNGLSVQDGRVLDSVFGAIEDIPGLSEARRAAHKLGGRAKELFEERIAPLVEDKTGRLYEVEIDANPEDFLDWDAPLSEQPAFAAIRRDWDENLGDPDIIMERLGITPETTGQGYINQLTPNGGEAWRSLPQKLREQGVPGIRYLDQGSRGAGDGTRNYVVFDDNLISIIKKYGIAGAAGLLGLSAQELQAQINQQQPATLDGLPR